jgi:RNA polymerase sigma-70 factor (ECF subfamily)
MNIKEFKDIYDAHFDAIRSFVFYRCGDTELASDVAQDVFMRVWEKRSSWNGNNLKPLLYKMASDCYVSYYRKELCRMNFERSMVSANQATPAFDDGSTEYDARTPEDEMLFNELTATYAKALEQMPEKQRTIYLMNREDGMKYADIADSLQVSVKTVEKYISAALRLLRTKLL